MLFRNCPQNIHRFTGHLSKFARVQKIALPSSEICESATVGLALVADQTSACRFAYTLSLCNLQFSKHSWKFWIEHSFQLRYIHCYSWCTRKPNLTTVSMELRFRELFSYDLWPTNRFNFAKFPVEPRNKLTTYNNWCIVLCLESFQPCLVWCCIYCDFCSFRKSNLPIYSMELHFYEMFFISNL